MLKVWSVVDAEVQSDMEHFPFNISNKGKES